MYITFYLILWTWAGLELILNHWMLVESAWSVESIPHRCDPIKRKCRRGTLSCCTMYQKYRVGDDHEQFMSLSSDADSTIVDPSRRNLLHNSLSFILPSYVLLGHYQISVAADHRQLELCLVNLLRVIYWAQYEIQQMDAVITNDPNTYINRQRAIYLETRLGAKAALTGRISGSGATNRVYVLTTLQLPGCLQDLEWYSAKAPSKNTNPYSNSRTSIGDICTSFREGLASIVEFDGLDTLTDPSPRSALTMSQFNIDKLKLIRRTLNERIIPDGQKLMVAFGPEAYQRSNGYVEQYYLNEIPVQPQTESRSE